VTNSGCPAFPFSHRPGIAMDPDYLKQMRIQPLIPVRLKDGYPAQLVTDRVDVKTVRSDPRFSRQEWAGGTLFARDTEALAW
jgi:hypothetical protein